MTSGEQLLIGIVVVVGGGLLLAAGKYVLLYATNAIASAIVKSINGQLGLDEIRRDIHSLKNESYEAAAARRNLQQQLERVLTEGGS